MLAELGHYCLILGFVTALLLVALPWLGVLKNDRALMRMARPLAWIQLLCIFASFGLLTALFLSDDFSVQYVQQHSNSALPWYFKVSAVWGAHEGSMLLWGLVLSGWTAAVAMFSKQMPDEFVARVLVIIGAVSAAFAAFMIFTSNPFLRLAPEYLDGNDLNPLLQHFGLIIHPPLLYLGYIGFVVAFAFAVAGLWMGRLDAVWARWSRPWTTLAWAFLTLGIMLGSWWAYTEVGWGGWWFWDPVENASFMPWITGTALIHSLAVTEKRGLFKHWTILLALVTFGLSILGTLLVRSGVLSSVHTFSVDADRGLFILLIFVIFMGLGLVMYAVRANSIKDSATFNLASREGLMLLNNVLLVAAGLVVLIGTIWPVFELAAGKKSHEMTSFGPDFFNRRFNPLMMGLMLVVGIGVMFRWKQDRFARVSLKVVVFAVLAVIAGVALVLAQPKFGDTQFSMITVAAVILALWTFLTAWIEVAKRLKQRFNLFKIPASIWGMALAHTGFAVTVVGVAMTSAYSVKSHYDLFAGQSVEFAGHRLSLLGVITEEGPNYVADVAKMELYLPGQKPCAVQAQQGERNDQNCGPEAIIEPELRHYTVRDERMREAGIDVGVFRDIHILLAQSGPRGLWRMQFQYKPYIRWIWLGCIIMALGAAFAVADRRYRRVTPKNKRAGARKQTNAPVNTGESS